MGDCHPAVPCRAGAREPAPTVEVLELADTKVTLAVRPSVQTQDYGQVRSEVLELIKARFEEAGIRVPYPKQERHVHQAA